MIAFRQEYQEMQSDVDSILTRLRMEFSNMTREASCNFVLLLSQMGCPSCSTGVRVYNYQLFGKFYVCSSAIVSSYLYSIRVMFYKSPL